MAFDLTDLFGDLAGASSVGGSAPSFNLGSPQANSLASNQYQTLIGQGTAPDLAGSMASQFALGQTSDGFQIEQNFLPGGANSSNPSSNGTLAGGSSAIDSIGDKLAQFFLNKPTPSQLAGVQNGTIKPLSLSSFNNGITPGGSLDWSSIGARVAVVVVGLILVAGAMYLFGSGTLANSIVSGVSAIQERSGNVADAVSSVKSLGRSSKRIGSK